MPCGVRKWKQMRWAFNIYEQQARVRTRTHHDLREREQHEGRPERAARHAQHLHTTPATERALMSISEPTRERKRGEMRTEALREGHVHPRQLSFRRAGTPGPVTDRSEEDQPPGGIGKGGCLSSPSLISYLFGGMHKPELTQCNSKSRS